MRRPATEATDLELGILTGCGRVGAAEDVWGQIIGPNPGMAEHFLAMAPRETEQLVRSAGMRLRQAAGQNIKVAYVSRTELSQIELVTGLFAMVMGVFGKIAPYHDLANASVRAAVRAKVASHATGGRRTRK
jgi:hypothetical protein